MTFTTPKLPRVAFLLDNLTGGGAQRVILNLASGFAEAGYNVDILICKMKGELKDHIPKNINPIELGTTSAMRGLLAALHMDPGCIKPVLRLFFKTGKLPGTFKSLPALIRYLEKHQPLALLPALPKSNIIAVLAGKSLHHNTTRIAIGVHSNYFAKSLLAKNSIIPPDRYLLALIRRYYRQADMVIAVSRGAAQDICEYLGIPGERTTSIYNPIAMGDTDELCNSLPDHPWFDSIDIPVILGIGRFVAWKNFPLLLDAFARVRQKRPARLVLLGGNAESNEQSTLRQALLAQARRHGVEQDVDMPGFVDNPYAYLNRAALFVLSSDSEGFGNVLVEALLCGCQVVSTDCPSGPAEILENGKYGELVPVGDADGLAEAICRALDNPKDKDFLRSRGRMFSIEAAVENYRKVLLGDSTGTR